MRSRRLLASTFPSSPEWALKALRTRAQRDYALSVIVLMLPLVPVLAFLWLPALIFLPLLLVAAWLTVSWEYWERVHNVVTRKTLWDRFSLQGAPEPRRESDRLRAKVVPSAVMATFSCSVGITLSLAAVAGPCSESIFSSSVGCGVKDDEGDPQKPQPFTSQDLHTALVEAFGRNVGLGTRLENVSA